MQEGLAVEFGDTRVSTNRRTKFSSEALAVSLSLQRTFIHPVPFTPGGAVRPAGVDETCFT